MRPSNVREQILGDPLLPDLFSSVVRLRSELDFNSNVSITIANSSISNYHNLTFNNHFVKAALETLLVLHSRSQLCERWETWRSDKF